MVKINKGLIMAAGVGSRIRPLSNKIPKPLIKVNGTPMIETVIKAMLNNGITEVYIVLGYMAEKFEYLRGKYEEVEFIYNEEYESRGAIASFYAAKDILNDNFVISDGNFYITEDEIFNTNVDVTTYLYKQADMQENHWGFILDDKTNEVLELRRPADEGALDNRLYGVAFWLKDDLIKLKKEVIKEYDNPVYRDSYHDLLVNNILKDITVLTKEVSDEQIYEINSLGDLVQVDKRYLEVLKKEEEIKFNKVVELAEVLSLNSEQLVGVYESPGRSTNNKNYVIHTEDETYFLRIAGEGTDLFADRESEKNAYDQLKGSGIVDEVYFIDPKSGMKISKFYDNSRVLNINDEKHMKDFMTKLKSIHHGDYKFKNTDNVFDRMVRYEKYVDEVGGKRYYHEGMDEIIKQMYSYKEQLEDEMIITPIHGDCSPNNTLILEDDEVLLIDLEFISMGDPFTDIANFAHDDEMNPKQLLELLEVYLERKATKNEKFKIYIFAATISIMWYSWAVHKMAVEPSNHYKFKDYRDGYYEWYKLMYKAALKYK